MSRNNIITYHLKLFQRNSILYWWNSISTFFFLEIQFFVELILPKSGDYCNLKGTVSNVDRTNYLLTPLWILNLFRSIPWKKAEKMPSDKYKHRQGEEMKKYVIHLSYQWLDILSIRLTFSLTSMARVQWDIKIPLDLKAVWRRQCM